MNKCRKHSILNFPQLVAIIVMMVPMVAVVAMPSVVGPAVVIAVGPIRSIVSVWVRAISIARIAIIAVSIGRITDSD